MKKNIIFFIGFIFLLWSIVFFKIYDNGKKPKFNPGNIINYPDWCFEQRCNLDINEYNFDFCLYNEIKKMEWKVKASNIVFYTNRVFFSDYSIIREYYYFKEDCVYLEWENISDGKPYFSDSK